MRNLVCAAIVSAATLVATPAATACGSIHSFGVAGDLVEASEDAARIGDFALALVYAKLAVARSDEATTAAERDLTPYLKKAGKAGTFSELDFAAAKAAGHDPETYRGACIRFEAEDDVVKWQRASLYVARMGRSEASLDAALHLPLLTARDPVHTAVVGALCPD